MTRSRFTQAPNKPSTSSQIKNLITVLCSVQHVAETIQWDDRKMCLAVSPMQTEKSLYPVKTTPPWTFPCPIMRARDIMNQKGDRGRPAAFAIIAPTTPCIWCEPV